MQQAGIEGEQVVLLLEDHQFVDPVFLELINSLLSAGEVPGLYSPEELEPLLSPLRDMSSEAGFRGTLINFFAQSKYNNSSAWLIISSLSSFYQTFIHKPQEQTVQAGLSQIRAWLFKTSNVVSVMYKTIFVINIIIYMCLQHSNVL